MAFALKRKMSDTGFARVLKRINKILTGTSADRKFFQHYYEKDGSPTTNTDIAEANGDVCLDYTEGSLYIATNIGASTTTWTRFLDLS